MAVVDISNTQLSNGKMTSTNLLVLGKNLTTNIVSLYVLGISTLENLSGISAQFLPISMDENLVYSSQGDIIGDLDSNMNSPTSTFTATFKVDYNSQIENQKYGMARNIYECMIMGQVFTHGSDLVRCVSVLGSAKTGKKATKCEINLSFGSFFKREYNFLRTGGVKNDGTLDTEVNTFLDKAKRLNHGIALETYTLLGNGKSTSLLFPCIYAGSAPISQDDAGDSYAVEFMVKSDLFDSETPLTLGSRTSEDIDDTDKSYFEVDYVVLNSDIANITDFGVSGETMLLVNPTTLAFAVYTSNGTAWTLYAGAGTMLQYCKISANKFTESTTVASATPQRVFVTAETVSTSNTGVATDYNMGASSYPIVKTYTLDRTNVS